MTNTSQRSHVSVIFSTVWGIMVAQTNSFEIGRGQFIPLLIGAQYSTKCMTTE